MTESDSKPESASASEPAPPPSHGKSRLLPALVFFIIAAVFMKFLWWDGLNRASEISTWAPVEVTVVSTTVESSDPAQGVDYELRGTFKATYQGVEREYDLVIQGGRDKALRDRAETEFADGTTFTGFVNPDAPTELALQQPASYGPWLVGFVPGVIFILIGFSVLRNKKPVEASPTTKETSPATDA